mmetsp:Transcript_128022/g.221211  ORF Transcript_128022/g.221211 Transcript_128022/m.221211 type:complete len:80 (-) Transcript_128022:13-252(-)
MDAEAFDELGGVIGDNDDNNGSGMEVDMNPNWGPSVWTHHPPAGNTAQQQSSGRAVANKSHLGWGNYLVFCSFCPWGGN